MAVLQHDRSRPDTAFVFSLILPSASDLPRRGAGFRLLQQAASSVDYTISASSGQYMVNSK